MLTTEIEQYVIDTVKNKRKEAKPSQAALAHLLEVSEGYIGNIESSKYQDTYNLNHINKLAKILLVPPENFSPKFTSNISIEPYKNSYNLNNKIFQT